MESFFVRTLSEADIDSILHAAGGRRAHPDADRRYLSGADYILGEAIIELKALDEEGLEKEVRQRKLATLFQEDEPNRPVIVIDRNELPEEKRRSYDLIMQGPVKTAVSSARKQLKQSKLEHPEAVASILFVINNGYGALNHEALRELVVRRATHDSREIDGVVVAGCYFHSDTFDSFFLWPMDYVPINLQRPFSNYDALRKAWNDYSNTFMTAVVTGEISQSEDKGPVNDLQFDVDGVTYVKPAPPLGSISDFFGPRRPRKNTSGIETCPTVAITFPDISLADWPLFQRAAPQELSFFRDFAKWQEQRAIAQSTATAVRAFVPMLVTFDDWQQWKTKRSPSEQSSIALFANDLFNQKVRAIMLAARERTTSTLLPSRYVLAVTEIIGQDQANDVSHIAVVRETLGGKPAIRALLESERMFHEHAIALASAYAVATGTDSVMWQLDKRHGWI